MPTYRTNQVAHVWAQQNQPSGKSNGALSFSDRTLYSYSAPIGHIMTNAAGDRFALLCGQSYSNTTSKHQSYAGSAVRHMPSLTVPDLGGIVDDLRRPDLLDKPALWNRMRDSLIADLADQIKKAERARTNTKWLTERAHSFAEACAAFAAFLGVDAPEFAPERLAEIPARLQGIILKQQAAAAKAEEGRQERNAARLAELQPWAKAWRMGLNDNSRMDDWRKIDGPVMLRLRPIGPAPADCHTVETSLGAEFPLDHALKAWPLLQRIRASGQPWTRNGQQIRLGHFHIDSVAADGTVKAGCHTLQWAEIESLAARLGLIQIAA